MSDRDHQMTKTLPAISAGTPPIFRITDAGSGTVVPVTHEDLDRMAACRPIRELRVESVPFGWIGQPVDGLAGEVAR